MNLTIETLTGTITSIPNITAMKITTVNVYYKREGDTRWSHVPLNTVKDVSIEESFDEVIAKVYEL